MEQRKDEQNSRKKLAQAIEELEKLKQELGQQINKNKALIAQLVQSEKELKLLKARRGMVQMENQQSRDKFLPAILVVEDDQCFRELIKSYLPKDYHILEAADGMEARKILFERIKEKKEGKPLDLIILDIMMPGMDGYRFCKAVKSRQEYQDIPIIICTAKNTRDDVIKVAEVGANDYLIKPFSRETLLEKARRWIRID